jgi:hypothetical protein
VEVLVRHCPECRRTYRTRHDICPECWERLEGGLPHRRSTLSLVFETGAIFEAEMLETLLRNEGIPCLSVPSHGGLLWTMASAYPLTWTRLYVRADMVEQAAALVAEVTGGGRSEG